MRDVVLNSAESELLPLKISGFTSFRQELEGMVDGIPIAYLNTFIEGEDHVHQVLTWTTRDRKDREFPLFRATVESFRELPEPGEYACVCCGTNCFKNRLANRYVFVHG